MTPELQELKIAEPRGKSTETGISVYAIRNRNSNIFTFHGANRRLIRVSSGN